MTRDLRLALRRLVASPTFTLVSLLAIAIGIGATGAISSVVRAVFLRPLPFREPERLVWVWERDPQGRHQGVSVTAFRSWTAETTPFESLAAYDFDGVNARLPEPRQLIAGWVSANFFDLVGVRPMLGRTFTAGEDRPEAPGAAVVTHGFWQRTLGGDSGVLGRQVAINGRSYAIVGVLPRDFWFILGTVEVWIPFGASPGFADPDARSFDVIARLHPGTTLPIAAAAIEPVARRVSERYPKTHDGWTIGLTSVRESFLGRLRPAFRMLVGAALCVLVIVCANLANLGLARAVARRKELAVAAALGASRARIAREIVAESLLLGSAGGAAGLVLATWGVRLILSVVPEELPRRIPGGLQAVRIDAPVVAFTLGLSLVAVLASALGPALHSCRTDPAEALRGVGRGAAGSSSAERWRRGLVVAEIAVATVVALGAALLVESYARATRLELGFQPANVLRIGLPLGAERFPQLSEQVEYCRRVIERASAVEGIESAALCTLMVVNPWTTGSAVEVEGERHDPARAPLGIDRIVSAGYFRTLAIPLEAGRTFEERDGPTAPPVAIVSRALARRLWPERDPIGRRIRLRSTPWLTIVGVAGDVRHPLRDEPRPVLYRPHTQGRAAWLYLVARTSSPPADRIAAAAAALRALDPEQPLAEGGSVEETLDAALSEPRFNLVLVCIFAAIALLLALVGIHGLIAYSVGRRTREIGIRMALGARADEVVALVGRSGARLALAGVALGTVSAWLLARAMAGIVYGIAPTRPWTFAAAAAFLLAVSSAASYFPARRASRVDPIVALRSE